MYIYNMYYVHYYLLVAKNLYICHCEVFFLDLSHKLRRERKLVMRVKRQSQQSWLEMMKMPKVGSYWTAPDYDWTNILAYLWIPSLSREAVVLVYHLVGLYLDEAF